MGSLICVVSTSLKLKDQKVLPKSHVSTAANLFVTNIPGNIDKLYFEKLIEPFAQNGAIREIKFFKRVVEGYFLISFHKRDLFSLSLSLSFSISPSRSLSLLCCLCGWSSVCGHGAVFDAMSQQRAATRSFTLSLQWTVQSV